MQKCRPSCVALGLVVAASGVVFGLASPAGRAVGLPGVTITAPVVTATTPTVSVPPMTTSPVPPPPPPTVPVPTVPAPTVTAPVSPPPVPPVPAPKPAPVPLPKPAPTPKPTPGPPVAAPLVTTAASVPSHPAPLPATPISPQAPQKQQQTASASSPGTAPASQSASPSVGGPVQFNAASASSASTGAVVSPSASKPAVRPHSSRASSLRLTAVANHHARTRSVYLVLHVAQRSRVHITLIGPTPSCLTARKLTRRLHPGVNRLKLGPSQVHGLQNGRYIVRVPVADRPKPLLTAVRIVAGHRVLPGRGRATLPQACVAAPPASTSSSAAANIGAGSSSTAGPRGTATPLAQPAEHGFSPKAIGRVARGAGQAAGSAIQTTGKLALAHLLLLVFISLLLIGCWAIIFPLARLIRPLKHL
jgi:outer membrane biosynthesis protein TonB